jgi:hypothetical protein
MAEVHWNRKPIVTRRRVSKRRESTAGLKCARLFCSSTRGFGSQSNRPRLEAPNSGVSWGMSDFRCLPTSLHIAKR